MCLVADTCPTSDPGVVSLIPSQSHNLVEIDHEIISMVLLPSAEEGLSITSESICTKYWSKALSSLPRKENMDRRTDRPDMTIAVDWVRKESN